MSILSLRSASLAIVLGLSTGACASYGPYGYGGIGVGYGSGYGGYGYNSGYGYSPYGYSNYGYGQPAYYGWNDGYYYPGTGYYVYDQYRRPYRWTSTQQRYWTDRQRAYSNRTRSRATTSNWSDFARATANIARENRRTRRD
jgi:hypothetical protein